MATVKITELPEISTVSDTDVLPIVDVSELETKKMTGSQLKTYAQGTLPTDVAELDTNSIITSPTEPTGVNRKKYWFQKGKNLFDKNSYNKLRAYIVEQGIGSSTISTTFYLKIKPNTQYIVSKSSGTTFGLGTSSTIPRIGTTVNGYVRNDNATSLTITSGPSDNYLACHFYTTNDTLTASQMAATVQVEQNATVTTYENYIIPMMYVLNNNDVYEPFVIDNNESTRLIWTGALSTVGSSITLSEPLVTGNNYIFTFYGLSSRYLEQVPFTFVNANFQKTFYDGFTFARMRLDISSGGTIITVNADSLNTTNCTLIRIEKVL